MKTKTDHDSPFSRQDRDLLVEHSVLLREIKEEITRLRDGTQAKINDHETRLRHIEDLILSANLEKRIEREDAMMAWVNEFKTRWKIYAVIVGAIVTLVSGVISAVFISFITKKL